ncbi:4-coumarate--CoA ligase 2 [Gossypium arboreum]|uniref:4-coumarate--CoA ligase 2 n=1 Tax=Gossypium arboreum TaxID=29729 RepID=A0A0B0PNP0_GOSAR|nr:4-coumarate--CoA ligase 2 [Gossypium arboreum]
MQSLLNRWIVANGSENIGSSVDCESRGSLLGGGVCIADLDSLLENGHPNASDVLQNCLSEELKQNIPVGKVVRSQDGARSVTSQKPMIGGAMNLRMLVL